MKPVPHRLEGEVRVDELTRIVLRGLSYEARHGVFAWERQQPQPFRVDVTMDVLQGPETDALDATVDYGEVERVVAAVLQGEPVRLLETLADRILDRVLDRFPAVFYAEVEVHKPRAPLAAPFEDVSVRKMRRRWVRAYLGLGSNLGDRIERLRQAYRDLASRSDLRVTAVSALYETEPQGVLEEQPWYYNAVLAVETILPPQELLRVAKRLEAAAGRPPGGSGKPRPLDVDLLFYGELRIRLPHLELPHPRAAQRAFVLHPLLEVWPAARLPDGRPVRSVLAGLVDQRLRRVADADWILEHAGSS